MNWTQIADVAAAAFLLAGAFLSFAAGVGLARFPDLFTRMHAATKPQVLGMLFILVGIGLRLHTPVVIGLLVLIAVLQLLTAPVSSHMVGRTAYRTGPVREDLLVVDELADTLGRDDD